MFKKIRKWIERRRRRREAIRKFEEAQKEVSYHLGLRLDAEARAAARPIDEITQWINKRNRRMYE